VDYDTFSDPFNARVALDSGDGLKGRLGVSAEYQNAWADDKGRLQRASLYGIANLYYEFLHGTQVDVSTVHFASANDRLWGGIGAGGSYNWADDKYTLFGEVSVNTSLASFGDSYSLNRSAGFRVKW
jgi:outer membrane autotransporter protein